MRRGENSAMRRRKTLVRVKFVRFEKIHVWKTKQDEKKNPETTWEPEKATTTSSPSCVVIEAWRRFSRSRVCLHDFSLQQAGARLENGIAFLVYFGPSVYKAPHSASSVNGHEASGKHVRAFSHGAIVNESVSCLCWSTLFTIAFPKNRNRRPSCVSARKLQRSKREIPINSVAKAEDCLVKVHRSPLEFHPFVFPWRFVSAVTHSSTIKLSLPLRPPHRSIRKFFF